jgi:hypothetical protein
MDGPFISSSFVFTLTFQLDSKEGKALMLSAPYCVTDGINEACFGAAILELGMGETHMDRV